VSSVRGVLMKVMSVVLLCMLVWPPPNARAESPTSPTKTPKETVEQLWKRATEGEFLTPDGWDRYSGFFLHPAARSARKTIRVVSNHWAVLSASTTDSKSDVTVEFTDAGVIDSDLNYTPPRRNPYFKTAMIYHLVLAPTRLVMYKSDGHTLTGKEEREGPSAWQIASEEDDPLTTVNTAIRHVLEIREKTNDSELRKRANLTLKKLLEIQ
jgi:hypothetical protein